MAHRKLKLTALLLCCTFVGIIGGALGTSWVFFHAYGTAGDFAAGRAVDTAMLLVDSEGRAYSQPEVYRNVLRSMQLNTVVVGGAFGSIKNPTYPTTLRRLLGHIGQHPELDAGDPENSQDDYFVQMAPVVRACTLQTDATAGQVSDCAVKASNQLKASRDANEAATSASATSGIAARTAGSVPG